MRCWWWVLACGWLSAGLAAAQPLPPLRPVLLSQVLAPHSLGLQAQVLEDASRSLALEQVLADGALPWRAGAAATFNFSFSPSVYWVRLRLLNDSAAPQWRVLETASAVQDLIDLHVVRADGGVQSFRTGDRRPFADRPLAYRYPVFPIAWAPHESVDVFIRLDTHDGLFEATPLVLRTAAEFSRHGQVESLVFGAYHGAIVALLLYNLLLFALTRDRLFVIYGLYLAACLTWTLGVTGYGFQYLWPASPQFNNQAVAVGTALIFITLTAFSVAYLQTRRRAPRLHRGLVVLAGLCTLPLYAALMDWYAATFRVVLPGGGILLLLLLAAACHIAWAGYRPARFYLLAWSALLLGAIVTFLKVFDLIPASPLVEYSLNITSALEFIVLALALADTINRLKAEKLQAESHALAVQTALAADLERQVLERTEALELANQQLQTAAVTDALTGVYNRRYFDITLRREFNRCVRQGRPLALCMVDIDYFKQYNDHWGHQQGDRALLAVAQTMARQVQRATEYLFRVGGEEFAVLMVDESHGSALDQVAALRTVVENMAIEHPDNPAGVVTVSCGLVWVHPPQGEPDALYAQADQALYRAKMAGRNRSSE